MRLLILFFAFFCCCNSYSAVYKCSDKGKITYSGTPCEGMPSEKIRTWANSGFDMGGAIQTDGDVITLPSNTRMMVAVDQYCSTIGEIAVKAYEARKAGVSMSDALSAAKDVMKATKAAPFSSEGIVRQVYTEPVYGASTDIHMRYWADCKDKYKFVRI